MVVNTAGKGGQTLHKRFLVTTNDSRQPRIELKVTGKVKGYINITPHYVRLMGPVGEALSATVNIRPAEGHPFTIKEAKAQSGKDIRLAVKPMGKPPGKEGYQLVVTSTKTTPGPFRDYIAVETDLKEKPKFMIPVSGRITADNAAGQPRGKKAPR